MVDTVANQKLTIRTAIPDDEEGIARVCLKTADSGQDASSLYSRSDIPALIWATPYLIHSLEHCFVVEKDREILGFVVTTANTRTFEAWQKTSWWPEAERRLQSFQPETNRDHEVVTIVDAKGPPAPSYADDYPAHLHINLLPEAQGTGFGRKLITTALDILRKDQVTGLHLGVAFKNTKAIGFYKTLGFREIGRDTGLIMAIDLG